MSANLFDLLEHPPVRIRATVPDDGDPGDLDLDVYAGPPRGQAAAGICACEESGASGWWRVDVNGRSRSGPLELPRTVEVDTNRCRDCENEGLDFTYDTNPEGLPVIHTCLMGVGVTGEPGAVRCGKCGSLDVQECVGLARVPAEVPGD